MSVNGAAYKIKKLPWINEYDDGAGNEGTGNGKR